MIAAQVVHEGLQNSSTQLPAGGVVSTYMQCYCIKLTHGLYFPASFDSYVDNTATSSHQPAQ